MTIYDLKPKFQNLLKPIVNYLYKNNVTPNQITIVAIILSAIGGVIVELSYFINIYFILLIPFIMFIRMALNAIDGLLAKDYNLTSKKGALLNELGDVVSDILLYLPFALFLNPILVFTVILLAVLTEFIGVLMQAVYNERRYNGPMGKSDRAFLFGLFSLTIFFNFILFSNILLVISIFLLIITCLNRIKGTI